MKHHHLLALVLIVVGSVGLIHIASAQDTSPVAVRSPEASVPCDVAPRSENAITVVLAGLTPVPGLIVQPANQDDPLSRAPATVRLADLPTGPAVSPAVREAIIATITDVDACDRAGAYDRAEALYTDEFFRRIASVDPEAVGSDDPMVGIAQITFRGTPQLERAWTLPDGRVVAVINDGMQRVVVILLVDDATERYLIDEEALLVDNATPSA